MGRSINSGSTPCNNGDFSCSMGGQGSSFHVFFNESYQSKGGQREVVITLTGESGVLTDTEKTLLKNNLNGLISLNNRFYRLQLKTANQWIYGSMSNQAQAAGAIYIAIPSYEWEYQELLDPVLDQHIHDTTAHVTQADRERWNNKLNYEMDDTDAEHLIINRN